MNIKKQEKNIMSSAGLEPLIPEMQLQRPGYRGKDLIYGSLNLFHRTDVITKCSHATV